MFRLSLFVIVFGQLLWSAVLC